MSSSDKAAQDDAPAQADVAMNTSLTLAEPPEFEDELYQVDFS